jgi:hypothetical protein
VFWRIDTVSARFLPPVVLLAGVWRLDGNAGRERATPYRSGLIAAFLASHGVV